MTSSTRSARCSGGKSRVVTEVTSGCLHGAGERDPVGIYLGAFSAGVHQSADGLVDAEQPVDLLTDHVGTLGTQHDVGAAAQPGLHVADRGLDLPPVVVQVREALHRIPLNVDE